MIRKSDHIVVAIKESKDTCTLALNMLLESLQLHGLHIKQFDMALIEQSFQAQEYSRGGSR